MAKALAPQAKAARLGLTEAHVQQTCTEFLISDEWRAFRTELTVQRERGRVVGEPSMPDYLYIRYNNGFPSSMDDSWKADAEVLWIEYKKPGQHPTKQQLAWHEAERKRGALVMVWGEFEDWWPQFKAWYKSSGLARRV